jgi:hypothetical protein
MWFPALTMMYHLYCGCYIHQLTRRNEQLLGKVNFHSPVSPIDNRKMIKRLLQVTEELYYIMTKS